MCQELNSEKQEQGLEKVSLDIAAILCSDKSRLVLTNRASSIESLRIAPLALSKLARPT